MVAKRAAKKPPGSQQPAWTVRPLDPELRDRLHAAAQRALRTDGAQILHYIERGVTADEAAARRRARDEANGDRP
jgi:hypothetical protein